jgi:hypothetical protein
MSRGKKQRRATGTEYTAIRMERDLYRQARRRAESRHQTYSEYVRQLIVRDVQQTNQPIAAWAEKRQSKWISKLQNQHGAGLKSHRAKLSASSISAQRRTKSTAYRLWECATIKRTPPDESRQT